VLAATWGRNPPGVVLGLVAAFLAGTVLLSAVHHVEVVAHRASGLAKQPIAWRRRWTIGDPPPARPQPPRHHFHLPPGIDSAEIIDTVHARPTATVQVNALLRSYAPKSRSNEPPVFAQSGLSRWQPEHAVLWPTAVGSELARLRPGGLARMPCRSARDDEPHRNGDDYKGAQLTGHGSEEDPRLRGVDGPR
jgi:hypothetical protein